jgi:hypothetical protein
MMIDQLQRLCEMVAVSNDDFRVVLIHSDYHSLSMPHRIDFFSVYDDADI